MLRKVMKEIMANLWSIFKNAKEYAKAGVAGKGLLKSLSGGITKAATPFINKGIVREGAKEGISFAAGGLSFLRGAAQSLNPLGEGLMSTPFMRWAAPSAIIGAGYGFIANPNDNRISSAINTGIGAGMFAGLGSSMLGGATDLMGQYAKLTANRAVAPNMRDIARNLRFISRGFK